jgi:hypothetical protein
VAHPSVMSSFFAPSMPFHPEELHKHVVELERTYCLIPDPDTNQKTALAKAIISATASFVEGCLDSMFCPTLNQLAIPQTLHNAMIGGFRGLQNKIDFAKKHLAPLRNGWRVKDNAASKFIENRQKNSLGLVQLRNKIDHGNHVSQSELRLEDIGYFRRCGCAYLDQVYASLGIAKPGWLDS